jgi:diguanylate cyclase (GGDEF)-like protein
MKYSISVGDLLKRINHTAVAVAVGIVFLATITSSFTTGLMVLVETAHVQARLLANDAIPLIRAGNQQGAYELLGSLRNWPQVYAAQLVASDHRVFARYVRNRPSAPEALALEGRHQSGIFLGAVNIRQDIGNGADGFGRITLTVGLDDLYRQTARIGVVMLVAVLVALGVSAVLLRRLKPSVLGPIQGLNRVMARVHGQSDFTVRARLSHVVEIDDLARGFNEMIEKIQERDRQLARLAFSDNLTGLPNRSAFLDQLEREVQRSMRTGRRLGLLFLDLDGFKRVNDTLGHEVGDRLLVEAAERIREALRPSDVTALMAGAANDSGAARLGGDEFTVLVPDLHGVDDAMVVARRVGDLLRRPFRIGGHEVAISGSIGAAVFPDHGRDASELLRNADAAMYHSKRSGRDNSTMYSATVAEHAKQLPLRDSKPRAAHG